MKKIKNIGLILGLIINFLLFHDYFFLQENFRIFNRAKIKDKREMSRELSELNNSGLEKYFLFKKNYHRTSKKAFNVFCATKQRKKRIIQSENRRKHLLRRKDDILYSTKEKWKEQIR